MKLVKCAISMVLTVTLISGCQTMPAEGGSSGTSGSKGSGMSKQNAGVILGALAGALLGSQVGEGKGRVLAGLLGAAGGAWIGSKIGAHLDAKDREAVEMESANALNNAHDGQQVSWNNPQSGASATMTPQNTRSETRNVTFMRDKRVEVAPSINLIGETYVATRSSNVRSGPSTGHSQVGSLRSGEEFTAVGSVTNAPWIMVAKKGVTVGYVYAPLVKPSTGKEQTSLRTAVNLDEIEDTQPTRVEGIDLDGVDLDIEAVPDSITATTDCRTMDYSIKSGSGQTETSKFDACKGSDGAWEII
jgi:surface antigen